MGQNSPTFFIALVKLKSIGQICACIEQFFSIAGQIFLIAGRIKKFLLEGKGEGLKPILKVLLKFRDEPVRNI